MRGRGPRHAARIGTDISRCVEMIFGSDPFIEPHCRCRSFLRFLFPVCLLIGVGLARLACNIGLRQVANSSGSFNLQPLRSSAIRGYYHACVFCGDSEGPGPVSCLLSECRVLRPSKVNKYLGPILWTAAFRNGDTPNLAWECDSHS
jgi:hypothetical protein